MNNIHYALLAFIFITATLVFAPISTIGYEFERNNLYTQNKFLQLKPNGQSVSELEDKIKPNIDLKGGSVQEEKELLSAFYSLGFTIFQIVYNYDTYPLSSKIGDSTVKANIISSLKNLRDLMAQVEAEDNILELINEIIETVENEKIDSKNANPKTLALLNQLSDKIAQHITNTFGQSYGLYFYFGNWTNKVMTYCELLIVVDSFDDQKFTKQEKEEAIKSLTEELRPILELSETFKSETKDLTIKAVSRNLDSIQEIASEIKASLDAKTAKRLYDYSLNIYYGIIPGN